MPAGSVGERLAAFARDLLQCFVAAERYAHEKGGIPYEEVWAGESQHSFGSTGVVGARRFTTRELVRDRKQIITLYKQCIKFAVDELCDFLTTAPELQTASRKARLAAALHPLKESDTSVDDSMNLKDLLQLLDDISCSFRDMHSSVGRSQSNSTWISTYRPNWRTQNLVFTVVKQLGAVQPPSVDSVVIQLQTLKEVVFSCLFDGDYLEQQRRRCSFRETLLQYIPYPGSWEADLSWLAAAFFISMPLASLAHSWGSNNNLIAFWSTFLTIFLSCAVGFILFFTGYKSIYSNVLLDKAGKGTLYERDRSRNLIRPITQAFDDNHVSVSVDTMNMGVGSTDGSDETACEGEYSPPERNTTPGYTGDDSVQADAEERSDDGSILRLYQASVFVQRIYGSTYLDSSWTLGLSEQQLYQAVEKLLQTDSVLGRQIAAFSFTSLVISSRGVPSPDMVSDDNLEPALRGGQVSFAIFAFLAALAFVCGMMSGMLADLIVRQLSFTHVKSEGTAHLFVNRFGLYPVLVPSLLLLAVSYFGVQKQSF